MKTPKPKNKNDASRCRTATPARGLLGFKAAPKREKTEREKDSNVFLRAKLKDALHNQPFVCFDMQINHLKKTP